MTSNRPDRRSLLLAPLAATVALSCAAPAPEPAAVVRPVRSEVVARTPGERARTFAGAARAGIESRLSFKVAGTVREIAVAVGEDVRSGDLVARLDPADYELRVREGDATVAQAEAAARAAAAEYERARGLYENRNTSRSHLDAARAQAESTAAQVEAARNRLALARAQVAYCTLVAPRAGRVAVVRVEVNENVRAGQVVVEIASGSRPEIEIAVPEVAIGAVAVGAAAEVVLPALPGRVFGARVVEVGVTSGATATTFPVRLRLDEEEAAILPGMAAEATLRFRADDEAGLWVDPVAVGEDRDGRFVFVIEAAEGGGWVARRRAVEVGDLTSDGLAIRSGLAPGERIATAGVRRLSDGLAVRLAEGDG